MAKGFFFCYTHPMRSYAFNFLFLAVGFLLSFGVSVFAVSNLEIEQNAYFEQYGEYFSDVSDPEHLVFTYETLCKGYYEIDSSNKNKIKYIGYGDLAYKYTYEETIDSFGSTTPLF